MHAHRRPGQDRRVLCGAGAFTYDAQAEPSLFCGELGRGIIESFKAVGKRFTFGAETAHDQRVYYVNTKEIVGNKYGTASPVPFRVVDQNIWPGLWTSRSNASANIPTASRTRCSFTRMLSAMSTAPTPRDALDSQLKSELLTALQPAFCEDLGRRGVRYSALPAHTTEIADA